jgi:hypothetical protein
VAEDTKRLRILNGVLAVLYAVQFMDHRYVPLQLKFVVSRVINQNAGLAGLVKVKLRRKALTDTTHAINKGY